MIYPGKGIRFIQSDSQVFLFANSKCKRELQNRLKSSKLTLIHCFLRDFSQSTSIPRKQQRVRDHGYDNYMEIEKKMRKVLKVQELILSQPNSMVASARLDNLSRRLGFKQFEAGRFVLKFPHIFDVFEHPVQRILYCRLTRKALIQIQQENEAVIDQISDAVTRLRKLLMLSNTGRLGLEHVRIARREFGFPEDFEFSVILKHPQFFRLFEDKGSRSKYIEIVERDPVLGVCAIEKIREKEYREKGGDAENIRFSFIVNFPPGFKIGKYYKIAVWKWQRLPYWSPYEDVSGYDMRSLEAQNRMDKRAIAMIHEIVSLTVEKKISLERIAHFRITMNLPKKLKDFLLQHQGIFYISTRGNYGKLHTIFLREAYNKGELIEPNELYLARRQLAKLITLRRPNMDHELVYHRRERVANHMDRIDVKNISEKSWTEDNISNNGQGNLEGSDSNVESDGETDEEDDCHGSAEIEENKLID
ncbi:protein ROOT PRIMORDIUM DEFECTIVE 1 isoform X1 [Cynara cardunculus var. scolymus]|uniref:protein ROOT PRIMORDIUM DEFECTIVE 1 isoform X1 n=1 Tax=Cynara cardunculus var. scolymus TaxID=59895 RepID=UPI000D62C07D|nr:protein ROOT PRIMORDIUM DEFECTIVE 1 isoform X1 [Cynara cardunculus var. scolymus]XP_024962180.1 protein ROOT PRIMORDIUM DEFECTIVE 1 isoform X1 [Cynara cardunculus var. scolymus]XP_024962181.1 protein ROOT PRIMORDIUM DEFECTIVE 1 isoform X1 [Cynara cardunculus var. scolymus]XP_024962182.1 protein ROOT PRIMORDIUM DEFECTIVE 1 isoform X1 [Cynara cardunculus var. scolymus]XP_024962183.1 protein ROOT PRIMORDIUM DEFECTIVE 1 isoform X1 [Cynara cardunculus var. scolymus]XP_024962184.1 protein ROOT PR